GSRGAPIHYHFSGRLAPQRGGLPMPDADLHFDQQRAIERLLRFLAVEGTTGHEKAIGAEVASALAEAGVPRRAMRLDGAAARIPLPTQTGNLRSEEHTSELQSRGHLVCRLLLEE